MKIRKVEANDRKAEFRVVTYSGDAYVDRELASEAFTYVLESGGEGSVHLDQVLEYNEDPAYLADLLTYKLTVKARKRIEETDSAAASWPAG